MISWYPAAERKGVKKKSNGGDVFKWKVGQKGIKMEETLLFFPQILPKVYSFILFGSFDME